MTTSVLAALTPKPAAILSLAAKVPSNSSRSSDRESYSFHSDAAPGMYLSLVDASILYKSYVPDGNRLCDIYGVEPERLRGPAAAFSIMEVAHLDPISS